MESFCSSFWLHFSYLDKIYGSDSKPLEHNQIQKFLAKSEILRGKPKLIFIQACQGINPGAEALNDKIPDVAADDDRISEYTDFYLSCASVAGDRSYRDIFTGEHFCSSRFDPPPHPIRKSSDLWTMSYLVISNCAGTWFISELCQTLCKFSRVMDLDEMQKKVNAQVVQNYTFHSTEKKKTDAGVSRMFFSSHWCWCTLVEPSTVDTCDIML